MKIIDAEYEKIVAKVKGGKVFGEDVDNIKKIVVASYHLGKSEGHEQANTSHEQFLKILGY